MMFLHLIIWLVLSGIFSANAIVSHCYVCSNVDSIRILSNIQDKQWKVWLKNLSTEPQTEDCLDEFTPEISLRGGVKSQHCNGACLKMTVTEKSGKAYIWRSCLNNSADYIRTDCTDISTGKGEIHICTCFGHLCNTTVHTSNNVLISLIPVILSIIY